MESSTSPRKSAVDATGTTLPARLLTRGRQVQVVVVNGQEVQVTTQPNKDEQSFRSFLPLAGR